MVPLKLLNVHLDEHSERQKAKMSFNWKVVFLPMLKLVQTGAVLLLLTKNY